MKKRIFVFLGYLAFWYLLFVMARVMFLLYYFDKTSQLTFSEILKTFIFGFRLDTAIAAYFSLLPSLLLSISSFFKHKFIKYFYHAFKKYFH